MISYCIDVCEETGSTNDDARVRVESGTAPHGLVLMAKRQTKGRGRQQRVWQSPPGNLYASLVVRPVHPFSEWPQLSFVMALAVAAGLHEEGFSIHLKWPNDVLVNEKKIAGLLLEYAGSGDDMALIIGFGVNVGTHPEDASFPATSLTALGKDNLAPRVVLEGILNAFKPLYDVWEREGFASIRAAWLARAWRLQQTISISMPEGPLEGRFNGLAEDGALRLMLPDGREMALYVGDVALGPRAQIS